MTGPVSPQAGGDYGVTCPCSCCADRAAQLAAGRVDAIGYCSCADYPSEERCDCPVCIQAADGRDDTTRRALADALRRRWVFRGDANAAALADALLPVVQQLRAKAWAEGYAIAEHDELYRPYSDHPSARSWKPTPNPYAVTEELAPPCPVHSHGTQPGDPS